MHVMSINTVSMLVREKEKMIGQIKIHWDICNFYLCIYIDLVNIKKQLPKGYWNFLHFKQMKQL